MKILYFSLLFVIPVILWAADPKSLYYQIQVEGKLLGYIEWRRPAPTVYEGSEAVLHITTTVVQAVNDGQKIEQKIVEKHVYQPQGQPARLLFYALEYYKAGAWEERMYSFAANKITLSWLSNGKKVQEHDCPLRSDVQIVTDYFSLAALLRGKHGQHEHPAELVVLDPKQISWDSDQLPLQKLTIKPGGERVLSAAGQQILAKTFVLKWDQGITLKMWLSKADDKLLQVEDPASKTTITLHNENIVKSLSTATDKPFTPVVRPIPFALGKNHVYEFVFDGTFWGTIQFKLDKELTEKEEPEGAGDQYKVSVTGKMKGVKVPYTFQSETVYTDTWQPVSYHVKEGTQNEIVCVFTPQGVKERYQKEVAILERFVPASSDFLLLDNNGLQHLMVFFFHCPLTVGTKITMPIFHPRRMAFTEGIFLVRERRGSNVLVEFKTPYYMLEITVSPQGELLSYVQGKLQVSLVTEKK